MDWFNSLPTWTQIVIALVIVSVFGSLAYYYGYELGYAFGQS